MSPRRSRAALTASPVLVGAVTVLVTIVAVFLSYNANTGLPFVPTYDLKANLPNASQLVEGFDVRIGGARVGQVSKIEPDAARGRHHLRPGHPQARQGDRAAAGRLHPARATALVARPQVPPGGARHRPGRLQGRRHGADPPGAAGGRGDRRLLQHVRRQGPRRIQELAGRLRHRLRRARPRPQHGDRRAAAAARRPRAGGEEPGEPARRGSTASSRRSPTRRPRSRRWQRSRPRCS